MHFVLVVTFTSRLKWIYNGTVSVWLLYCLCPASELSCCLLDQGSLVKEILVST